MPRRSRGDVKMIQYVDEDLVSLTSSLKQNFRTISCDGQAFPCFNNKSRRIDLPCELHELILSYLPACKLLELKAVCKSWRNLVQRPRFKERWKLVREGCSDEMLDVWVMKSIEGQEELLLAYIPAFKKYSLFLPLICSPLVMTQPIVGIKLKEMSFLCADGPCIVLADRSWRSGTPFIVYNSCTSRWKSVREPPLPIEGEESICSIPPSSLPVLIIQKKGPNFCLLVEIQSVSENRPCPSYQLRVYQSSLNTWTSYPQSSALQADFDDMSAILCGDFFKYDYEDRTLYAWSTQHWSKIRVMFSNAAWPLNRDLAHQNEANAFKVMRCEGRILMITSTIEQEQGAVVQCFIIWKLMEGGADPSAWSWFEISRTPPELCLKSFNKESFLRPTFMCDGSCVCIMSSSHEYFPPLVYDVEHDSWCHLHGVLKDMQALFAMKVTFDIGGL